MTNTKNTLNNSSIEKIKSELCHYSHLAYNRGLIGASGGNISYKIDNNSFIISPTNKPLRNLDPDELIIIDSNCNLKKGKLKPSKEALMHITVYKKLAEINCVIHLHPPYATSFSNKKMEIPMATISAKLKLIKTPLIEFAKPGSKDLTNLVSDKINKISHKDVHCLLLCGHGTIAFGNTIEEAYNFSELVEETAKIAYLSLNLR